jgi:hypothetical protein
MRHAHSQPEVVRTSVGEATVVAPDFSYGGARPGVGLLHVGADRGVDDGGVEAIEPMP